MFHDDKLKEKIDLVQSCTRCDTVPCSCVKEKTDPLIGQVVSDHFIITELIGAGGMGSVYKAKHTIIGKVVAVKILSALRQDDPKSMMRFQREAQAVAGLNHPNLVSVQHFGFLSTDQPFIVMDYVAGRSLSEVLHEDGLLQPGRAIRLFSQICSGLAHAHNKGIVHRDLKPSNIMITKDDAGKEYVKVVDFGIAKIDRLEETLQTISETGEVLGSPLYMSPEQCAGGEIDWRSDLYSFGCVMCEAMSGVPPFSGKNALQTLYMHINETAPKLSSLNNKVPPGLETIIQRCLEKDPENRYQSATEIQNVLEGLSANSLTQSRKPSADPAANRASGRSSGFHSASKKSNRIPLIVGSLIGISIVGLLVGSYLTIASNHASLPTAHVKTNVSLASARPDSTNYFAQVNKLLADADNSRHQGHNSKAIQLLKEADDICNEKFDKDEIHADVYFALGLAQQSDQPQDAIASFEKAADLFSERRNDLGFRNASVNAANNLKDQRMYTEANPLYERAIQNMEKTGEKIKDPMSYAVDVSALAKNEAHLGHQAQADKLYQSALGVSRQSNYDPLNRLRMLKDVSEFYVDRYDERAKQLLEEATTVKVTVDAHNRGDVESLREQLGKLRERLSIKNKGP